MAGRKPLIDADYYKNYAGSGRSYNSVYRSYSYSEECIELFQSGRFPKPRGLLVLGAATGRILKDFDEGLGLRAWGCEISEWAWSQIPATYRGQIARADMLDYLDEVLASGTRFDLCFTNALGYLPESSIEPVIAGLAQCCDQLHFNSSFLGKACPDPYRNTLKPVKWWIERFEAAGFETQYEDDGVTPLYLWRNPMLESSRTRR